MKKIFNKKNAVSFIFLTLVASAVFVGVRMYLAPSLPTGDSSVRVKGDYVLMLLQCIVGIIAMLLPGVFSKHLGISIPTNIFFVFALFLFCAIYLGEVRDFYYKVPHWDTILHTFSGAMLGALGVSVLCLLNRTDKIPLVLSPLFVAVFSFCFAVSVGVIWEIYEFTADAILNTNMQKFALENGELLVGRAALMDTMKDLIVDCIGALVMSVVGYIATKRDRRWLDKLVLKRVEDR